MATTDLQIVLSAVDNTKRAFGRLEGRLGDLRGRLERMQPAFQKMALAGSAAFAGIGFGVFKATQAASDAQEVFNKFDVVFGDVRKQADAVGQDLRDNFGLAESSAKELLSSTGDMLTGFGLSGEAALTLAEDTNKLAVDLASFTNIEGGAERASQALTKALLGERESVKELGIAILEEDVKAKVAAMRAAGELTDETDRQAKAIATLQIAYEQSQNAIGDFARTSDSLANQQRVLGERFKELSETFGAVFIPILNKIVGALIPIIEKVAAWVEENPKLTQAIVIVSLAVAGLVAAVGILGIALIGITAVFGGLAAPIAAVVAAIAVALIPIITLLLKHGDFLKEETIRVWNTIKDAVTSVIDFLVDTIGGFINDTIDAAVDKVTGFIDTIKDALAAVRNFGSKVASTVGGAVSSIIPFAHGGIVTQPTLGLVGEAGPEAIVPLNQAGALGGGGVTLNLTVGNISGRDGAEEVGDIILERIKDHLRL